MIRRHGNALRTLLMVADGAMAAVLGLLLYLVIAHPEAPFADFLDVFWTRSVLFGAAWVVVLYFNGAYRLRAHWTLAGEARTVARATVWLAVVGIAALLVAGETGGDRGYVLLLFPLTGLVAIVTRTVLRFAFMYFRRQGHNVRNLLILGTGDEATTFARTIRLHSILGVQVVGYLGDEPLSGVPQESYWGRFSELPRILREEVIDEIAVCIRPGDWPRVEEFVNLAHEEGKLIRVPLVVPQLEASRRFLEDLDGTAVLSFSSGPDELAAHAFKRVTDVALAGRGAGPAGAADAGPRRRAAHPAGPRRSSSATPGWACTDGRSPSTSSAPWSPTRRPVPGAGREVQHARGGLQDAG